MQEKCIPLNTIELFTPVGCIFKSPACCLFELLKTTPKTYLSIEMNRKSIKSAHRLCLLRFLSRMTMLNGCMLGVREPEGAIVTQQNAYVFFIYIFFFFNRAVLNQPPSMLDMHVKRLYSFAMAHPSVTPVFVRYWLLLSWCQHLSVFWCVL